MISRKNLVLAMPCQLDWRAMTPADGGRFCGDCKKVVRDLSAMRESDARALLHGAKEGELCVRYVYDRHGRIFFAGDHAAPLIPASLLQRAKRVARSAAAIAVPLALQACSPEPQADEAMGVYGVPGRQELTTDAGADGAPDGGDAGPK